MGGKVGQDEYRLPTTDRWTIALFVLVWLLVIGAVVIALVTGDRFLLLYTLGVYLVFTGFMTFKTDLWVSPEGPEQQGKPRWPWRFVGSLVMWGLTALLLPLFIYIYKLDRLRPASS